MMSGFVPIGKLALAAVLTLCTASLLPAQGNSNLQNFGSRREERSNTRTAAPAKPAKQPDQKPAEAPKTPEKPARPAGKPAGKGEAPAAPAAAGPQFQMGGGANAMSLRLTPEKRSDQMDLNVTEGGLFTTDVMLANPGRLDWDEIRLIFDYNPKHFDPVSINDTALGSILDGPPVAHVDRRLGQITYLAKLDPPQRDFEQPLLFIKWKAIEPALFNSIAFGQGRDRMYTDVLLRGEPLLGDPAVPDDGAVGLAVSVIPADPAEALIMQEDPNLYLGSNDRIGGVQLLIEAPKKAARVGKPTELEIRLDNRNYSMMDAVSLLIEFDPDVLEVVDDDWDNWITRNLNMHDGSYRTEFPWDYHIANAVYPAQGLIEYRVGTSMPKRFIGANGTFVRLTVVPKKATAGTAVRFLFSKRAGTRSTEVAFLGQDVLGSSDIKNDGVRGIVFPVLP